MTELEQRQQMLSLLRLLIAIFSFLTVYGILMLVM